MPVKSAFMAPGGHMVLWESVIFNMQTERGTTEKAEEYLEAL